MAKPPAGVVDHGQSPLQGQPARKGQSPVGVGAVTSRRSRQQPRSPTGMAGACERKHHPRRGHKGQPRGLGCRLQGRLLARAVTNRGSARARRHCPPARCRPRAGTPVTGAVPTPTTCSAAAHAGVMVA
ncbi:hypothetical protein B296_00039845 [Ensete ventricosum]|uniref:Uncharacterized protein n=1 Tax=Ensete ventricosum TaxID=4639 RepID=A0A426Y1S9_ENSVE|nr:hypothetical protein B296_00039845 [Ensete ventricosum]